MLESVILTIGAPVSMRAWQSTLDRIDQAGLYPLHPVVTSGISRPICQIDGLNYLSFSSNNYLSLSNHVAAQKGAIRAIEHDGVGPGSSRVIGGTSALVQELEALISDWTGFEDCVTFPTGYLANLSVVRALLSPLFPDQQTESIVFPDQYAHGSIMDGCRLAGVKVLPFRHNDLDDLEAKLQRYQHIPNKLVITEGVFVLEGLTINLPDYINLARRYDAMLMLDDAHAIGIHGVNGGGTPELFGSTEGIDVYMGCLDKAAGGTGGFLCGSRELIRYLRVACRACLLSSPLPSMLAGAMIEAIKILSTDRDRRRTVLMKAGCLKADLQQAGFDLLGDHAHPALILMAGNDALGLQLSLRLWDRRVLLPVMRWPAVPPGQARFRINVTFDHTEDHLSQLVASLLTCR